MSTRGLVAKKCPIGICWSGLLFVTSALNRTSLTAGNKFVNEKKNKEPNLEKKLNRN